MALRQKLLKRKADRIAEAEAKQAAFLSKQLKAGGRPIASPLLNNTRTASLTPGEFRQKVSQSMLKVTGVQKKTSCNYQKKLTSCKNRWLTWCKKRNLPLDAQPTSETIKAFIAHLLSSNAQSKRKQAMGEGNKLKTVVVVLRLLRGRVWPVQFPCWPVRELNDMTDEVEKWLLAQHSEEGVKAVAQDMCA